MKFIHYSDRQFELKIGKYEQIKDYWPAKPNGLWFSVQGPYDWEWWCRGEDFRVENLEVRYEIKFKEDAKLLFLDTEYEIFEMAKKYPFTIHEAESLKNSTYVLNWEEIKKEYQGIVIPQYQWACRMSIESCWYYGWDCACGCVWDLECIEEFKLLEKTNE